MDSPSSSSKAATSAGTSSQLHGSSPVSPSSSSTANNVPTLPTVVVSHVNPTGSTRTVKARIDSNVPLDEIIRQLCSSPQLAVQGDPAMFALRDQKSNELVTDENVRTLSTSSSTLKS